MLLREFVKALARAAALVLVTPSLFFYSLKRVVFGRDRALESSSQKLSLIAGLRGEYMRRAFLARVIARCAPRSVIGFGVLFSRTGARIDDHVYIGPRCHLGLVHLERDVLLAAGVHIPSGGHIHGTDPTRPIREQEGAPRLVRIGAGSWIGSNAVVLADVGSNTIVGAGAVVTRPVPSGVVVAGVPARIVKQRTTTGALLA
jgi:acetyltransferase-like isoleucine patch superfamily enzyme